jgi:hypothetical protein
MLSYLYRLYLTGNIPPINTSSKPHTRYRKKLTAARSHARPIINRLQKIKLNKSFFIAVNHPAAITPGATKKTTRKKQDKKNNIAGKVPAVLRRCR